MNGNDGVHEVPENISNEWEQFIEKHEQNATAACDLKLCQNIFAICPSEIFITVILMINTELEGSEFNFPARLNQFVNYRLMADF